MEAKNRDLTQAKYQKMQSESDERITYAQSKSNQNIWGDEELSGTSAHQITEHPNVEEVVEEPEVEEEPEAEIPKPREA